MRARSIVAALAAGMLAGCGGSDGDASTNMRVSGHMMSTKSMTVGKVDTRVEPRQMDQQGAMFRVTMDTHEGALDMDMERGPRLMVDGREWPMRGWTGDGPGGHHREGELHFGPGGPVRGMAQLTMPGSGSSMMQMRWQMTAATGSAGG